MSKQGSCQKAANKSKIPSNIYKHWTNKFYWTNRPLSTELVVQEAEDEEISLIVIVKEEILPELKHVTLDEFYKTIDNKFGITHLSEKTIGQTDFVLITLSSPQINSKLKPAVNSATSAFNF